MVLVLVLVLVLMVPVRVRACYIGRSGNPRNADQQGGGLADQLLDRHDWTWIGPLHGMSWVFVQNEEITAGICGIP